MADVSFPDLPTLAQHLRDELERKKFVLLYAYNGVGKTRLSGTFRDLGRVIDANGETTQRDTLYFNAYTEDLFTWDNDLAFERKRVLELNADSRFFAGLRELEMEVKIGRLLARYTDLNFYIDYERREPPDSPGEPGAPLPPAVTFFREREDNGDPRPIKASRGEESIFIWCFFLAIVELATDSEIEAYRWVKYVYIDDPISSLDEQNAILVANHLAQLLTSAENGPRVVVSTHHVLFFNVLCNELKNKAFRHFLRNGVEPGCYILLDTTSKPFLHHLSTLVELHEVQASGELYTHHFNMLRRVMEQTANFLGLDDWKTCIKVTDVDSDRTLFSRMIDLMSHGDYSIYEPREMMEENKAHFRTVFRRFVTGHPFNPALFPRMEQGAGDP
ncbi:AAA family ATPase [Xanthomonas campestris pv. campestris]|uniref:AAA family ATPase n=1 Tax=Xanthomonas campestris TaxID=339 RepID=UPI001A13CDBF|nr:AAA family ATPase [Xanthomonas campestris]MBF9171249.1 AAA family ATPase [Xanthomonas campestris pv. campestris]MDO0845351.1 AAA family ATPase [Xanthomonas campestris pv. campestris]MEB1413035.1 AAA family ATPase [Xanthomonas campestris pv. campestris]MEB1458884.1 AAA family ATPase [Xanthomonas campestris pv. campestris]MEB1499895.1 AAA family ATPase [Xanthomonas campestris pv. campestris]